MYLSLSPEFSLKLAIAPFEMTAAIVVVVFFLYTALALFASDAIKALYKVFVRGSVVQSRETWSV